MVDSLSLVGLKKAVLLHGKAKDAALRNFGLIIAAFFGIVLGLLPVLIKKSDLKVWTIIVAAFFLVPSITYPRALKYFYQVWMLIGMVLGWIQTRIILSVIYFLLVTPIAIVMRLSGKDILDMKWNKSLKTYRNDTKLQSGTNFDVMY